MTGIRTYFTEKKEIRKNWRDIEEKNQILLDDYNIDYRFYAECLQQPVKKTVFYETNSHKKTQLPFLFEAFSKRSDFTEYNHIWVFRRKKDYNLYKKELKKHSNVRVCFIEKERPQEYYQWIAEAAYLFQEGTFPSCFVKRKEQYLVMVEKASVNPVGYESGKHPYRLSNKMHCYLMADAILFENEQNYQKVAQSFRLEGFYEGNVWIADITEQGDKILETVLDEKSCVMSIQGISTEKKKLLFYGGGMGVNGVTEALLALLDMLDYEKYDVTVFCWMQDEVYSYSNIERIPKNVRTLVSKGADPYTREEQIKILYMKTFGIDGKEENKNYEKNRSLVQRAAFRRFGKTSYECAIDFSGYAVWVPLLFLEIPAKQRFIWEHPDIKEDFAIKNSREEGNKSVLLEALLSVYRRFDKIVAVNQVLMELNRKNLATEDTYQKFVYATNLLNTKNLTKRIAQAKEEGIFTDAKGRQYIVCDSQNTSLDGSLRLIPFEKKKNAFRFVTMARMSQEKNHKNLILAFQEFLKQYPDSQLYLIGDGVLRKEMQNLVMLNGMEKNIIFTGNLRNPFLLMQQCDCFVFPSCHEGQGLVVLEARMLQMPILISNYNVAPAVCIEQGQYVMGMSVEEILQGLLAYAAGEVPADYCFTLEEYNQKAICEFYDLLEE